ncbi:hypothetical protein HK102_001757 [Quaeritorhiza haematococci]|nr:hypothetical protein HK102_001757 [Quaeritorhiza haematococci]
MAAQYTSSSVRARERFHWWPKGPWSRIALTSSIFQALVVIALECYVLWLLWQQLSPAFKDSPNTSTQPQNNLPSASPNGLPVSSGNPTTAATSADEDRTTQREVIVFHASFVLAMFFQIYVAYDALITQNILVMYALVVYSVGSFAYSIIQQQQSAAIEKASAMSDNQLRKGLEFAIIALTGLYTVVIGGLIWKLLREFGWAIYRKIGASVDLRRILRNYHLFLLTLRFTVYFLTVYQLQLITLPLHVSDASQIIAGVVIFPWLIVTFFLGYYGLKRESKPLMWAFVVFAISLFAYVMFRMIRMFDNEHRGDYHQSMGTFLFFGVASGVMLTLSLLYGGIVMGGFGKGLKEALSYETPTQERNLDLDA